MCWHNTSTTLELGALLMLANANRSVLGGINKAFQMVSYKDWTENEWKAATVKRELWLKTT